MTVSYLGNAIDRAWSNEIARSITILIVWYLIFNLLVPVKYGDENANQNAITGIFNGDWAPTQRLAVIPGYHWFTAQLSLPFGPSLILSRFYTLLMSVALIYFYYAAARKWKPTQAGHAALLMALLPIVFPYTAAAYTDVPALMLVVAAVWALTKGRYNLSAAFMFLSCFVRQSNLVWFGLMATLAAWDLWQQWKANNPSGRLLSKEFLVSVCIRRLYGYVLGGILFLVFMAMISDSLIWGHVPANRPRPNMGNFFSPFFYTLLFWAPIFSKHQREYVSALKSVISQRPARAAVGAVAMILLGTVMALTYDNFHPWNQPFQFITNIPLVLMADHVAIRIAGILIVFWTTWMIAQYLRTQPYRMELALVLVFFIIFMLPHALVDPRYYFVAFALFNLFVVYTPEQAKRLIVWWATISAMIGIAIIFGHFRYTTISW